jgi:hypothetical protein
VTKLQAATAESEFDPEQRERERESLLSTTMSRPFLMLTQPSVQWQGFFLQGLGKRDQFN